MSQRRRHGPASGARILNLHERVGRRLERARYELPDFNVKVLEYRHRAQPQLVKHLGPAPG